jgi:HEAT repeat protein
MRDIEDVEGLMGKIGTRAKTVGYVAGKFQPEHVDMKKYIDRKDKDVLFLTNDRMANAQSKGEFKDEESFRNWIYNLSDNGRKLIIRAVIDEGGETFKPVDLKDERLGGVRGWEGRLVDFNLQLYKENLGYLRDEDQEAPKEEYSGTLHKGLAEIFVVLKSNTMDDVGRVEGLRMIEVKSETRRPDFTEAANEIVGLVNNPQERLRLLKHNVQVAKSNPIENAAYGYSLLSQYLSDMDIKELIEKLKDADVKVRAPAAKALNNMYQDGKHRDTLAAIPVAVLVDCLEYDNYSVRYCAVGILRLLDAEAACPAIPALKKCLRDSHPGVVVRAAKALGNMGKFGEDIIPDLHKAVFNNGYPDVRRDIVEAMYRLDRSAARNFIDSLSNPGSYIHLLQPDVLEPEVNIRFWSIEALGNIGDGAASAVPTLIKFLNDPVRRVRFMAIEALGYIGKGAASAVPSLIKLLNVEDGFSEPHEARAEALHALGRIGPPAVPGLTGCLEDKSFTVRFEAAIALCDIGSPVETPALRNVLTEALEDPDPDVKSRGKSALGALDRQTDYRKRIPSASEFGIETIVFDHTCWGEDVQEMHEMIRVAREKGYIVKIITTTTNSSDYERVAQEAGLRPDQILFTDDVQKNLAAARNAGMQVAFFNANKTDNRDFISEL